ncbi:zinc finger protein 271-like, partial [Chelydra serpentina]
SGSLAKRRRCRGFVSVYLPGSGATASSIVTWGPGLSSCCSPQQGERFIRASSGPSPAADGVMSENKEANSLQAGPEQGEAHGTLLGRSKGNFGQSWECGKACGNQCRAERQLGNHPEKEVGRFNVAEDARNSTKQQPSGEATWEREKNMCTECGKSFTLFPIEESTRVRNPINAWSVEKASIRAQTSFHTEESTQERSPINASSVRKASFRAHNSTDMRERTRERNPINALSAGKASFRARILFPIREATRETDPTNIPTVGKVLIGGHSLLSIRLLSIREST